MPHQRRNVLGVDLNDEMANAREAIVYFGGNLNNVSIFDTVSAYASINKYGVLGTAFNIHNGVYYAKDGNLD